jgi:hypothetical protein
VEFILKTMKIILAAVLFFCFTNILLSQDLSTLGILDMVPAEGVSESGASVLTDIVFDTVFELGSDRYNIIDRQIRDELLSEQQFALSDLSDEVGSALEAGKYLSADYMLISSFAKLGSYYYVTFKIVNVSTSLVESSSRAKTENLDDIEDAIYTSISDLLNIEVEKLVAEEASSERLKKILKTKPSYANLNKIPLNERILLYERADELYRIWNGVNFAGAFTMLGAGTYLTIRLLTSDLNAGAPRGTGVAIGVIGGGATLSVLGIIKSRHYTKWKRKLGPYIPERIAEE